MGGMKGMPGGGAMRNICLRFKVSFIEILNLTFIHIYSEMSVFDTENLKLKLETKKIKCNY
jgi:hypothetical protein